MGAGVRRWQGGGERRDRGPQVGRASPSPAGGRGKPRPPGRNFPRPAPGPKPAGRAAHAGCRAQVNLKGAGEFSARPPRLNRRYSRLSQGHPLIPPGSSGWRRRRRRARTCGRPRARGGAAPEAGGRGGFAVGAPRRQCVTPAEGRWAAAERPASRRASRTRRRPAPHSFALRLRAPAARLR